MIIAAIQIFKCTFSIDWFKGDIAGTSHHLHGKIYGFL